MAESISTPTKISARNPVCRLCGGSYESRYMLRIFSKAFSRPSPKAREKRPGDEVAPPPHPRWKGDKTAAYGLVDLQWLQDQMNILPHYYVILFPLEVHLLKGRCWRYFNLTWQKSEHFSEIEKYPFSLEQRNSRTYLMYSADWREWKELVQCKFTKFLPSYQNEKTIYIVYCLYFGCPLAPKFHSQNI